MKHLTSAILCLTLLLTTSHVSAVEPYPGKPITAVVGGSPGQSSDLLMRLITLKLAPAMSQPILVDNRPGAGASLGPAFVARSAPDGHTLLLGTTGPLTIRPSIFGTDTYDPIKSFSPVSAIGSAPLVLAVAAHSDIKTIDDLITRARSDGVFYGSPGVGSINHLTAEMLAVAAGVKLKHIPYKGTPQIFSDVIGGQIHFVADPVPSLLPHLRSGRLRALGVADNKRSPLLPDVPTFAEAGIKGVQALIWFGILAPAKTPTPVLDRLERELDKVRKAPDMQSQLADLGLTSMQGNRASFGALIASDTQKWKKAIQQIGGVRADE